MEVSVYLLSGVLMGVFLLGTVALLTRSRRWRHYSPTNDGPDAGAALERLAEHPATWMVGFLALALGLGLGAVVFVGGFPVPEAIQSAAGTVMLVVVLAVFAGYTFLGVYHAIRYRGLYRSQAAAAGIWIVGVLAVAGIAVMLLTAS